MSAFLPQSPLGLPATLDYKLPPSLSEDSKSYWVSISPDGVQSVPSASVPIIQNTALGSSVNNAFNSQLLQFTIPSGTSRSVFMDCRETTLNFRMTLNITTAAAGTGAIQCLVGSAQSFFDSLQLFSNNIPIESIQGYNLLCNQLLNATVNLAERQGGCAIAMGIDNDSQSGIDLPTDVRTVNYNFSIPLVSVIGLNNAQHLFPIGSLSNLQLQMTTSAQLPIVSYSTAFTTAGAQTVTLDQFTLNMKYIDIGSASAALLSSGLNEGKIFMKTQTFIQAATNLPSGSLGQNNLLYQIRNSSLKSLIIQNSVATSTACPNGLYDAINLGVTQFNVSVGGIQYPQKPCDPSRRPAETYLHFLSALGYAGDYKKYGGVMNRSNYGACLFNPTTGGITNIDNMMVQAGATVGVRAAETGTGGATYTIIKYPNMHIYGVDLEKSGGILFNGVNTRSAPPVGNFFISTTVGTTVSATSFAWGLVDCVLVVDQMSQTIQAFT